MSIFGIFGIFGDFSKGYPLRFPTSPRSKKKVASDRSKNEKKPYQCAYGESENRKKIDPHIRKKNSFNRKFYSQDTFAYQWFTTIGPVFAYTKVDFFCIFRLPVCHLPIVAEISGHFEAFLFRPPKSHKGVAPSKTASK